jgi:Ala-tRNA(Pro) deacylase
MQYVEDYLKKHAIEYTMHEHPAVFTCDDAEIHCKNTPGTPGKNLFLRDKKGKRYFLVILPASKRADLKWVGEVVGDSKISFASPERLKEKLDLTPGAVSPFGLINDAENEVEVLVDQDMYDAEVVNFHPNRNTASVEITNEMFHKLLELFGNKFSIIQS